MVNKSDYKKTSKKINCSSLVGLHSVGSKESKTIDITSVDKVPDTIPEGKEVLPEGKEVGKQQTSLFATGLD